MTVKKEDSPTIILKNKPFKSVFFIPLSSLFYITRDVYKLKVDEGPYILISLDCSLMDVLEDLKVHSTLLQMLFFSPKM